MGRRPKTGQEARTGEEAKGQKTRFDQQKMSGRVLIHQTGTSKLRRPKESRLWMEGTILKPCPKTRQAQCGWKAGSMPGYC